MTFIYLLDYMYLDHCDWWCLTWLRILRARGYRFSRHMLSHHDDKPDHTHIHRHMHTQTYMVQTRVAGVSFASTTSDAMQRYYREALITSPDYLCLYEGVHRDKHYCRGGCIMGVLQTRGKYDLLQSNTECICFLNNVSFIILDCSWRKIFGLEKWIIWLKLAVCFWVLYVSA